uniref:Uncharacterized protein n=1 Tax=Anguilla anguilla TaxID=7936 RepID=A0A0E9TXF2_ANGAN
MRLVYLPVLGICGQDFKAQSRYGVRPFGDIGVASLLFADDVILLAFTSHSSSLPSPMVMGMAMGSDRKREIANTSG